MTIYTTIIRTKNIYDYEYEYTTSVLILKKYLNLK